MRFIEDDMTPPDNSHKVLHSYEHEQGYAVDIIVRADGTFGFEHFRRDIEDGGRWTMIGSYAEERFANRHAAQRAASERIAWFDQDDAP